MDAQKGLSVITRKLLATPEGQYYDFKATLDALKVANMVARARLRAHAMDANDKAPRLHTGGIPSWARIIHVIATRRRGTFPLASMSGELLIALRVA